MDFNELNMYFRFLAVLGQTDSSVISRYINNEAGCAGYLNAIDRQIREIESPAFSSHGCPFPPDMISH